MTLDIASCTYGYRRRKEPVLQNFDYRLAGGLTILLGPNGAGKSTVLKIGASTLAPHAGSVSFDGLKAGSRSFRQAVAWMPQDIVPAPGLTAREYVAYIGWLKGMDRSSAWQQARRALSRVQLAEKADVKTNHLSGGQLRRVGVAGALVHDARVLLLDEPTAGMDPQQRRVFRNVLNDLASDVQVLLSTHDIADLAEEADNVSVLHSGQILHHGATESFLAWTPPGAVSGRAAEAAYTAMLEHHGCDT
ncbi:ATP-binding cassette domain-containing protein [Streptomyces sp. M10(2022)]